MGMEQPIRVVLVEDHELFRNGLRSLLDEEDGIEVVDEAPDGESATAVVAAHAPDVVVMDMNLPARSGVETTREIRTYSPTTRVLMLSISEDADDITDALVAGACGYLLKDSAVEDIADGIRGAVRGEPKLSARIAARLLERVGSDGDGELTMGREVFTDRELEVLNLIAAGDDYEAIGVRLSASPTAIRNHLSNLLAKLEAAARIEAALRSAGLPGA